MSLSSFLACRVVRTVLSSVSLVAALACFGLAIIALLVVGEWVEVLYWVGGCLMLSICGGALAPSPVPLPPISSNTFEEAQKKSIGLLESWLSPLQLHQFRTTGEFNVVGSRGGSYRIRDARVSPNYNVSRLNSGGQKTHILCFMPAVPVPAGDIMLAQKIALESDENAARLISNMREFRHSPATVLPGGITYVSADNMLRLREIIGDPSFEIVQVQWDAITDDVFVMSRDGRQRRIARHTFESVTSAS